MRLAVRPLILATALVAGALAAVPASAAVLSSSSPATAAATASRSTLPSSSSLCPDATTATFGPNVCVFTPSMSQAAIQSDLNNIAIQQVPLSAQFNNDGYAVLFEPGTYGSAADPLVFEVGYYTEVAGLGAVPQDTTINGQIEVFPNALDCATATNCWANSTVNFWRSMSNLTLNVMDTANNYVPQPITQLPPIGDSADCYGGSTDIWSVSQATPVRSMIINGNLNFQAYCSQTGYGGNDFASGSYVANSEINGQLAWSGNQQGIARNSDFDSAAGYVWNYVYSGDGCPPGYTPPTGTTCSPNQDAFGNSPPGTEGVIGVDQVTALPQSPVTEEEPFLTADSSGNLSVFVPSAQKNSSGPNFLSGSEDGSSLPLSSFFVANPSTPVWWINAALARGKNLILTPGVYNLRDSIVAPHPNTVILGLGFPTLVPQTGRPALWAVSNVGVKMSGFIVDAGPVNSRVLVGVGTPGPNGGPSAAEEAANPDLIQDVFFRVGGAETTPVSATVSLLDNASHSIIDDVWAWRADHGANTSVTGPQGQVGAGWTFNKGDTGVIVNGDDVTAYGLAVEHYQKTEVIWNGQGGTNIFFQNELPYDPPTQAAWNKSSTQLGYPAFEVSPRVTSFNGYGMASYVVFIYTNATLWDAMAYQAPNKPGVKFTDAGDLFISSTCSVNGTCPTPGQSGGLQSVIDGVGGSATDANLATMVDVDSYANGVSVLP
jgi:hypothetical protein